MKLRSIAAVAAALLLVGCSGQAATPTPTPTPTPTKKIAEVKYSTLADFKADLNGVGIVCAPYERTDKVKYAAQSGDCGSAMVISIYASYADAQQQIEWSRRMNIGSGHTMYWVTGENWIINAGDMTNQDSVISKTGGTAVKI